VVFMCFRKWRGRRSLIVSLMVFLLLLSFSAWAHRPLWDEGVGQDAAHAIAIKDANISQVAYHEITSQSPRVWLTFEAQEGQEVYLELGVPVIDRLKNFRPALTVLGPALPTVQLPFEIPAGLGGQIFDTETVKEPRVYHEPFTGTDSWVWREVRFKVPATGKYFVVAYVPSGETGKVWVALGEQESFGLLDIFRFPGWRSRTRQFHEIQ
ncbi:MAG: hypothetical protein NT096_15505, partial [Proteobacteria bacterium]|nr:hypothetical protein [Pseudomonadota bacterium]